MICRYESQNVSEWSLGGFMWSRVESEWSQHLQQLFDPLPHRYVRPTCVLRCLSPVSRQLAACGKGNKLNASFGDRGYNT